MGELFAMSAGQHYTAQEYLPLFADQARAHLRLGIGFFRRQQPMVEKSGEKGFPRGPRHSPFS